MDDDETTAIYVHEEPTGWVVTSAGSRDAFGDAQSAKRHAISLARAHVPSVIVAGPPGTSPTADRPTDDELAPPVPATIASTTHAASSRTLDASTTVAQGRASIGPVVLGRSLIVRSSQPIPPAWVACPVISVTTKALGTDDLLMCVRTAYLSRTATVFAVDDDLAPPAPTIEGEPIWSVAPDHDLTAEDTWDLMMRNGVDLRSGSPRWWLLDAAVALGATVLEVDDADVALPDGRHAVIDGGPLDLSIAASSLLVVPAETIDAGQLEPLVAAALTSALDPSQTAAVAEPIMRSRIIAPAGSGKTRVLTERARHLVASGIPASTIVMVAFNKRAQEEMEERTRELPSLRILTLNALSFALISGTRGFLPRNGSLSTLDERGVRELLSSMVTFPRRANVDPAASWIEALSSIRLGLRSPREVEAEYGGDVDGLAEVFPRWRQVLADRRQVDFDEQVYLAIEVLLTEPDVREHARRSIGLLLVDEYQDLNPAHMLLLRLLAGPRLPIFGVGDDDQTIYGYSGATPEWLVDIDRFIPASTHHALSTNYRCPVPVVEAASNLLTRNRVRVPKTIEPGPHAAHGPGSMTVVDAVQPVAETTRLVMAALDGGATPSEICVLSRVNALLAPVEVSLREQGIAVTNRDGGTLLSRTGTRSALAWFSLATTGSLSESAVRDAARRPSRSLSPRVIDWMAEQRDVEGLRRLAGRLTDDRSAGKVADFAADLERLSRRAQRSTTPEILEAIRTELGLDQSLAALDAGKQGRNASAHSDDLRALVALGHLHPEADTFLVWLHDALGRRSEPGGVSLATVHKVKGLEWPHVIVHDASGGVIPHRLSTDVEEERRVFHVAITRATTTLAITSERDNPSLFLDELAAPGAPVPVEPRAEGPATTAGSRREGIPASVGLRVLWGGYDSVVTGVHEGGVTVSIGSSSMSIPFGSSLSVDGQRTVLSPPSSLPSPSSRARASAPSDPNDAAAFDALKAWRLERSRTDGVPAYVVADNKTLEAIASAMPADDQALLAVPGIGPTKLELYGEEILAVLDALRR